MDVRDVVFQGREGGDNCSDLLIVEGVGKGTGTTGVPSSRNPSVNSTMEEELSGCFSIE